MMTNETTVNKLPARSEIVVEDTWRLEDIFASDDAWEKEFQEVKALIPHVKDFQGKLGESAGSLYEALQFQMGYWNDLVSYIHIRICVMIRIQPIHFIKA